MSEQAASLATAIPDTTRALVGAPQDTTSTPTGCVLRPVEMVIDGRTVQGAELPESKIEQGSFDDQHLIEGLSFIEGARTRDVRVVYSAPVSRTSKAFLRRLGFDPAFELCWRSLPLTSLGAMRYFARVAREVRHKLIEVVIDGDWLHHASSLFAHRRPGLDFAVARDVASLESRYRTPGDDYRMLVLRRRAGVGIDAFAILRTFDFDGNKKGVRLIDHWTKQKDRRAMAWLLGELALWGLAERIDVLQAFAVSHSLLDQTLIASGCIRKKSAGSFMIRQLGGETFPAARLIPDRTQLRAGDLMRY